MVRNIIIGAAAAFLSALVLHLILPGILAGVLAVLMSGATLLDPLYAGERVETIWATTGAVLLAQTLQTFITAPVVGAIIGYFLFHRQSGWIYLVGSGLSLIGHYILLAIFAAILSFLSPRDNPGLVWGSAFALATIVAPIIGLVSTFAVRRWGTTKT
jgi:hypothetical protein